MESKLCPQILSSQILSCFCCATAAPTPSSLKKMRRSVAIEVVLHFVWVQIEKDIFESEEFGAVVRMLQDGKLELRRSAATLLADVCSKLKVTSHPPPQTLSTLIFVGNISVERSLFRYVVFLFALSCPFSNRGRTGGGF